MSAAAARLVAGGAVLAGQGGCVRAAAGPARRRGIGFGFSVSSAVADDAEHLHGVGGLEEEGGGAGGLVAGEGGQVLRDPHLSQKNEVTFKA